MVGSALFMLLAILGRGQSRSTTCRDGGTLGVKGSGGAGKVLPGPADRADPDRHPNHTTLLR